jgi:hypothetical protein
VEPSPPRQDEGPVKDVDQKVPAGSLKRFKSLASKLFGVDRDRFQNALQEDEKERAKRRALAKSSHAPKRRKG